ncbi:hypothetical protein AB0957_36245, partial [Streptomyces zhihengii]
MTLEHPADRGGSRRGPFERLAEHASNFTSSPAFFGICMLLVGTVIGVHIAKAPLTWMLLAGESMTAVTLLLLVKVTSRPGWDFWSRAMACERRVLAAASGRA